MRIVAIGDVGVVGGVIHLGDEAMLAALIVELRLRGIEEFTIVSANPTDTAQRYGVDAVGRLDIGATAADREDRMDRVIRAANGETGVLSWQDPAWPVIEAVASADAVVIAGGGNLSSIWPEHIAERATLGELAAVFSKPLIITGQSIGPALTQRDGELLARLLGRAALVGVREGSSRRLVAQLGIADERVRQTIDDATFLGLGDTDPKLLPTAPYCLVTFAEASGAPDPDRFATVAAGFVDAVARITGVEVILLAHVASVEHDVRAGDAVLHDAILQRVSVTGVRAVTTDEPAIAAQLARGAELSISTRYHSTVFASSAGVATIGIALDDYTDAKVAGALENFGQLENLVPLPALYTGDACLAVEQVWMRRKKIRRAGTPHSQNRASELALWWDDVASALRGEQVPTRAWRAVVSPPLGDAALRGRLVGLREWMLMQSHQSIATTIATRALVEERQEMSDAAAGAERAAGVARADLVEANDRAADADAALRAANNLAVLIADPIFANLLSRESSVVPLSELETLLNTKLFRWSRFPRRIYGYLIRRR
jgi:polysaccharide pyruvyl transferase WcaK-like protein